jgi:hypothetical protein
MDCSRTSLRHGAEHVTIAYRRTRSELVVDEEELGETEREGVRMEFLVSPIEILGEDGKVSGVRFIRNRLGEPDASGRRSPVPVEGSEFVVKAQTVIPAVSLSLEPWRHALLDRGGAQHMGIAELDQARAFGMDGNGPFERDRAHGVVFAFGGPHCIIRKAAGKRALYGRRACGATVLRLVPP